MAEPIKDRMEILFLYETKDCNPNGDPLDGNKPRMDSDTDEATVTDVRIKRTVREYFGDSMNKPIWIRTEPRKDNGYLAKGEEVATAFRKSKGIGEIKTLDDRDTLANQILKEFIDTRLFGVACPLGARKPSIMVTGPVQFSGFNRSLHRINPKRVEGTAAFATAREGRNPVQRSFREDWIVPYACIAAYGVVNEQAATTTGLSEEDVDLLLEGLWKGTESLISRSKMGHQPLFLVRLRYKDGYRIGDLAGRITLESDVEDMAIRSVENYTIDVSGLLDAITDAQPNIASIDWRQDNRLVLKDGDETGAFDELSRLNGLACNVLNL